MEVQVLSSAHMPFIKKSNIYNYVLGLVIGLAGLGGLIVIYCRLTPSVLKKFWEFIVGDSAFLGGFSAGLFTYYFNSKSRVKELRHTKYFEHRNTIVQIEHELIGVRVNLSRNLESIKIALEVKENRYRFILRFFNLNISPGLSLRLLDLDLINKYSEMYIIFQSINSDIEYLKSMVEQIKSKLDIDNPNPTPSLITLMNNYLMMLDHVHKQLLIADKMSLELVAICKIALSENPQSKLNEYVKTGGEIKYSVPKIDLDEKMKDISTEEDRSGSDVDPRPKFVALYFDLIRVIRT
jgi:hypothetical protein